jgi:hypothetical protein
MEVLWVAEHRVRAAQLACGCASYGSQGAAEEEDL